MVSGSWTTTMTEVWSPLAEGAQVPASRMAFSSSSLICSALYLRTLRRSFKTFNVSFMFAASFLSLCCFENQMAPGSSTCSIISRHFWYIRMVSRRPGRTGPPLPRPGPSPQFSPCRNRCAPDPRPRTGTRRSGRPPQTPVQDWMKVPRKGPSASRAENATCMAVPFLSFIIAHPPRNS